MRTFLGALTLSVLSVLPQQPPRDRPEAQSSLRLDDLSSIDAGQALKPDAIVLIPLGAASQPHGTHLKLRNDAALAEFLTARVAAATPVVVAPALTYHHYPELTEYPGATSLSPGTARELTADVVRSLGRHGPRRFYVLSTSSSATPALAAAADVLSRDGILLRYTDPAAHLDPLARALQSQDDGSHAGEIETSMMLYTDPALVDMSKVVKDGGVWGDPTGATTERGRVLVDGLLAGILADIAALRAATPPPPSGQRAADARTPRRPDGTGRGGLSASGCSEGDERSIRQIGDKLTVHWRNGDAEQLAALWAPKGDMAHPDGLVERTPLIIRINRAELFKRREYRLSRHSLQIGVIRCLSDDIAVADGKWELRDVMDANGILPAIKGLCTLVVRRLSGSWYIEAYRYTIDAPSGPAIPTLLKRPGYPGGSGGSAH